MAWSPITDKDIRLAPAEKAMLKNIAGSDAVCADILGNVIGEFLGAIQAGGYEVSDNGKIPDSVRMAVINRTRWQWLIEFPQLKAFQTKERADANTAAEAMLKAIGNREFNIEPFTPATPSGNWNSDPKLLGRTHPIPKPSTQFQGDQSGYANPDGPADA